MDLQTIPDKVFWHHMDIILKACIEINPNLDNIILCGGYGRNEGSWFIDEHGALRPYNDYDICIITDVKTPKDKVKNFEQSLAKEIGISWLDFAY